MANKQHRYQLLADALEISVRELEKECNLTPGRIGTSIYRNSNIKGTIVDAIMTRYPNVNRMWLETGQGNMFTTPAESHTLKEPDNPYASKPAPTGPGFFNWLLRKQQEYIASRAQLSGEELEELARIRKKIERLRRETGE